jgi:tetratricopeptide (TPR) repeat protein
MNKKIILGIIIVILIATGTCYYFWKKPVAKNIKENAIQNNDNSNASSTEAEFYSLLQKGIDAKTKKDYVSAANYWIKASQINPLSAIPYNNLGDLYAHFAPDKQKAEQYFRQAVQIDPHAVYIYRSFYEFYRYVMKDDVKTKAILQEGIKNNPTTSSDLKYLFDNY